MCLANKALPLWVSLLSSAERAQRGQQGELTLPMEVAAALMDLAGAGSPTTQRKSLLAALSDVDDREQGRLSPSRGGGSKVGTLNDTTSAS